MYDGYLGELNNVKKARLTPEEATFLVDMSPAMSLRRDSEEASHLMAHVVDKSSMNHVPGRDSTDRI